MGLRRLTMPAIEPVTVAALRASLRIDDGVEDPLLMEAIQSARSLCEEKTGRTLVQTQWRLTLDAFSSVIEVPRPPLVSIESIKYLDLNGAQQTLDPSAYRVDPLSEPARIEATGAWPSVLPAIAAVTIDFTAGYGAKASDVPVTLRRWITLAAGDFYTNRERSTEARLEALEFVDGLLDGAKLWPR